MDIQNNGRMPCPPKLILRLSITFKYWWLKIIDMRSQRSRNFFTLRPEGPPPPPPVKNLFFVGKIEHFWHKTLKMRTFRPLNQDVLTKMSKKSIFSNPSCFALYVASGRHPPRPTCAYWRMLAVGDAAFGGAGNFLIFNKSGKKW